MITSQIRAELDVLWANKACHKLHWLQFERFLADILKSPMSDAAKVRAAREALDAFTRRGHFNADDYFPTIPDERE